MTLSVTGFRVKLVTPQIPPHTKVAGSIANELLLLTPTEGVSQAEFCI
jgi:hypothetical protein